MDTPQPQRSNPNRVPGEFALCNEYGLPIPDLLFRPGGDGGLDLWLYGHPTDVKTSTYTGPQPYLRVPIRNNHPRPETIYVAGRYHRAADDVYLIGWEWGHQLLQDNHRVLLGDGPHCSTSYVKPYEECRRMAELANIVRAV